MDIIVSAYFHNIFIVCSSAPHVKIMQIVKNNSKINLALIGTVLQLIGVALTLWYAIKENE